MRADGDRALANIVGFVRYMRHNGVGVSPSTAALLVRATGLVGLHSRQGLAAVCAGPHATTVRGARVAHACRLRAMWADEHHVADRDRLRNVQDATLLDARLTLGPSGHLARLGGTLGDVEALDHDRGTR